MTNELAKLHTDELLGLRDLYELKMISGASGHELASTYSLLKKINEELRRRESRDS